MWNWLVGIQSKRQVDDVKSLRAKSPIQLTSTQLTDMFKSTNNEGVLTGVFCFSDEMIAKDAEQTQLQLHLCVWSFECAWINLENLANVQIEGLDCLFWICINIHGNKPLSNKINIFFSLSALIVLSYKLWIDSQNKMLVSIHLFVTYARISQHGPLRTSNNHNESSKHDFQLSVEHWWFLCLLLLL